MEKTQSVIQTIALRKQFSQGDVPLEILHGIDLSIDVGQFVAIMGPSGSGKSTLLTILGGIETPSSGQVLIEGTDLAALADTPRTLFRRRRIGFVFQAFNLIPTITAQENVALPLELDGVRRADAMRQAAKALELVEMSHRLTQIPARLSGGEQQRIAIARATIMQPALLLADEPTGNLDSRQGERVSELLRTLSHEHKQTIVMVTHDAKVAEVAGRRIVMRDGSVESDTGSYLDTPQS